MKMVIMIPGPPSRLKLEVTSYDHDEEEEKRNQGGLSDLASPSSWLCQSTRS